VEKLESIAFLALCLGVPVAMVSILVWRGIAALRDRSASAAMLEDGWDALDDAAREDLAVVVGELGMPMERAHLHDAVRRDDVAVARYRRRARGNASAKTGGADRWLIVAPCDSEARCVVEPRTGGVLEKVALGIAGDAPRPGWEWAIVSGPHAPPDDRSGALRPLLRPGERLHVGGRAFALSLNADLVRRSDALAAFERATELRAALGH